MFIWWLASMVLVVYGKHISEELILDLQHDPQPEKDDKSQWTEVEINEHNRFTGTEEEWEHKAKRGAGKFITKWPKINGKLIIPYVIDSTIPVSTTKYNRLAAFVGQMNNIIKCNPNTWRLRTNEPHYVQFTNSTGCSSFVGKADKSPQKIKLADGCVLYNNGTVLHEMMHAMGFYHEQSRYDRDQYVTIKFENIREGRERNFNKVEIKELNSPYDYGSVMHYRATAFSRNGLPTIVKKHTSDVTKMGQRKGLSEIDKNQLNDFYGCTVPPTQPPTTTPIRIEGCDFKTRHHDCFRRGFNDIEDEACKDQRFSCPRHYRRCRSSRRVRMYCPKTCKQCVSDDYLTLKKYTKRVRRCLKRRKSRWGRRRRRCVKWQQRIVTLSSYIRTHIEEGIIEYKLNCQCQSRTTCDKVNFCVSFTYRRRPSSGAIGKQSTIGVCLVNPEEDEGYTHRRYNKKSGQICTESNTQMLAKAATFKQWKNASFRFKGECRNIEMTLKATKGSDDIDIKHVTIYGGDCPAQPLVTNDGQIKTDQKRTVLSSKMVQLKDEFEGPKMSLQKLDSHE